MEEYSEYYKKAKILLQQGNLVPAAIEGCMALEYILKRLCDKYELKYNRPGMGEYGSVLRKGKIISPKFLALRISPCNAIRNNYLHPNRDESINITEIDVKFCIQAAEIIMHQFFSKEYENENHSIVSIDTKENLSFTIKSDSFLYPRKEGGIFQQDMRKLLRDLNEKGYLPPAEVKNLQRKDYSKKSLGIEFPLIVKDEKMIYDNTGKTRYWKKKKPIRDYYVCSEWWQDKFPFYLQCMREIWVPHLQYINR